VFEFNERAIRAYRRCGFVIEGRSRESIWRDGRWWDELAMSVLESDWRRQRDGAPAGAGSRGGAAALIDGTAALAEPDGDDLDGADGDVDADGAPADGGGATTRLRRRTLRSWR
jgi:hypothetical protein